MNIEQVKKDLEAGILVSKGTLLKLAAHALDLERDAKRYQLLRKDDPRWYVAIKIDDDTMDHCFDDELDSAVDRLAGEP